MEHLEVVLEHSLAGESQSNGAVEDAIKRLQGQIMAVQSSLEHSFGEKIEVISDVWHWMIERVADTFNRRRIGVDGVTPYKGIR